MHKSFKQYLSEAGKSKSVVFTFGRFSPPTTGHEKLINKVASIATGNNYRIYPSQSHDSKKNPLKFEDKVKFMRKMFPKHGRNIVMSKPVKTAIHACSELYAQGFTECTLVVGSDRVKEFDTLLNKYNGVEGRHGIYNFENGVEVVSAGERDPDAEGVEGMSASKMRKAAAEDDLKSFTMGVPSSMKPVEVKKLFDAVRSGLGIKESNSHVSLSPISETRERFIRGEVFRSGDEVIVKSTGDREIIESVGANYVTINGSKHWLSDLEEIKAPVKTVQERLKESILSELTTLSEDFETDLSTVTRLYNVGVTKWKQRGMAGSARKAGFRYVTNALRK